MTMTHGKAAGQLNEQAFIEMWLAEAALAGETRFDPTVMVQTILSDRLMYGSPDPEQTRNYVLHCVRLAPHVCRHAVLQGVYAMHEAAECSEACKTAWAHHRGSQSVQGPLCPECFTYAAASGVCLCG